MNLRAVVSGMIQTVNPDVPATLKISSGVTTGGDGIQVSKYLPPANVFAQVQPLSTDDLKQMDGINMNGTHRSIYFYGEVDAIVRVKKKGGDLIQILGGVNAGTWLVVQVLEQYEPWCRVGATLQNDTTGAYC